MSTYGDEILVSKDAEITSLKAQLEAHQTYIAILQQKLQLAYDNIDQIKLLYVTDLQEGSKAKKVLEDRLRNHQAVKAEAEAERDELRRSVMDLITKVESGFTSWPRSHMQTTGPLSSIIKLEERRKMDDDTNQLLSYAAAMIDSLWRSRTLENRAHVEVKLSYEAQIRTLQAQVARRDAELMSCVEHAKHYPIVGVDANRTKEQLEREKEIKGEGESITPEEMIRLLRTTTDNNKVLELEVKSLFNRLHDARLTPLRTQVPSLAVSSAQEQPSRQIVNTASNDKSEEFTSNAQMQKVLVSGPQPHTRAMHLQKPNARLAPSESINLSPLLIPIIDNLRVKHDDVDETVVAQDVTSGDPPHTHQIEVLKYLDDQIDQLSFKIDAFKAERAELWQTVALERFPKSQTSTSLAPSNLTAESITEAESAPSRSQQSEQWLREKLQISQLGASNRECKSHRQNEPFVPLAETDTSPKNINLNSNDINNGDGEMSMDLATPLLPVNIILPDSPKFRIYSPTDPNNDSPRMIRPRILPHSTSSSSSAPQSPSPSPLALVSTPSSSNAELALDRVEQELAEAQYRLEEGEQQLKGLQDILNGIQIGR